MSPSTERSTAAVVGVLGYDNSRLARPELEDLRETLDELASVLEKAAQQPLHRLVGRVNRQDVTAFFDEMENAALSDGRWTEMVLFWTGHGESHHTSYALIVSDSPETGVHSDNGVLPEWIAERTRDLAINHLSIFVDSCESERAARAIVSAVDQARATRLELPEVTVIFSSGSQEPSTAGAMTEALLALLSAEPSSLRRSIKGQHPGHLWDEFGPWISASSMVAALRDVLDDWGFVQNVDAVTSSVSASERTVPNPLYGRLDVPYIRVEELDRLRRTGSYDHFWAKASGVDAGADGWLFTPRTAYLAALTTALRSPLPNTMVLTGRPGAGKSSILGYIALLADGHIDASELHDKEQETEALELDAVVWCANRSTSEIREVLWKQLRSDARSRVSTQDLFHELSARPRRLLFDAVDEAHDSSQLLDEILLPLARRKLANVVVGTRRNQTNATGPTIVDRLADADSEILDLDSDQEARLAFRDYVSKRLAGRARSSEVAREIADACEDFLTVRLTADVVTRSPATYLPNSSALGALLEGGLAAAFDADLDQTDSRERAEELLRPLAWTSGLRAGPNSEWAGLAMVLATSDEEYTEDDIAWVVAELGRHLVVTTRGSSSVYRLYHESYAELLRSRSGA